MIAGAAKTWQKSLISPRALRGKYITSVQITEHHLNEKAVVAELMRAEKGETRRIKSRRWYN
jgi:hypothetical protein